MINRRVDSPPCLIYYFVKTYFTLGYFFPPGNPANYIFQQPASARRKQKGGNLEAPQSLINDLVHHNHAHLVE